MNGSEKMYFEATNSVVTYGKELGDHGNKKNQARISTGPLRSQNATLEFRHQDSRNTFKRTFVNTKLLTMYSYKNTFHTIYSCQNNIYKTNKELCETDSMN